MYRTMMYLEYSYTVIYGMMLLKKRELLKLTSNPATIQKINTETTRIYYVTTIEKAFVKQIADFMKLNLNSNPRKLFATFFKLSKEPTAIIIGKIVAQIDASISKLYNDLRVLSSYVDTNKRRLLQTSLLAPITQARHLQSLTSSINEFFVTDCLLLTDISATTVTVQNQLTGQSLTQSNINGQGGYIDFSHRFS